MMEAFIVLFFDIIRLLIIPIIGIYATLVVFGIVSPWWMQSSSKGSSIGSINAGKMLLFPFKIMYSLISWILKTLYEVLQSLDLFKSNKCKGSHWMKWYKERSYLSKSNNGFVLDGGGSKRLSLTDSTRNMVVISRSGGGKSSRVIINNCLGLSENKIKPSQVIIDLSGEIHKSSHKYLQSQGYRIRKLDLTNPKNSVGFNIFNHIKSTSDIKEVIDTLFLGSKDPFWDNSAKSLLSFCFALIRSNENIIESFSSLTELIDVIASKNNELDAFVIETNDQELLRKYKAFQAMDERTFSGVVASSKAVLERFENESVLEILDPDKEQIDFKSLRDHSTALFITVEETRFNLYAPLLNIFFTVLFRDLARYDNGLPVFCLMDEFGQLRINNFSQVATTSRKRKIALLLMLQEYSQLVTAFGTSADTLYKGAIGSELVINAEFSYAKKIAERLGDTICDGVKKTLISAYDISQLDKDEAIFLSHKAPVFLKKCKSWYEVKRWKV